ncbi:MAG TPA: hypothetical protein VMB75_11660 [Rhodocyclaceae bacterium]|nr:hypothetical protein [Rhodocyclaceae bacterium]
MANQLAVLEQAQSTLVDLGIKFGPRLVVATLVSARDIRIIGAAAS